MMFEVTPPNQDVFMCLRHPTIVEIRSVLEWAHKHALRTDVSCLDVSKNFSRRSSACLLSCGFSLNFFTGWDCLAAVEKDDRLLWRGVRR